MEKLGNITLIHDDCMNVLRKLPDKCFDLAIVDPPYGINVDRMAYTKDENRKVKQKNGSTLNVHKNKYNCHEWDRIPPNCIYFNELFRVSKNQIIWGVNYMPVILNGGRIVWDKCNGNNDFSDCEIAFCSLSSRVKLFRYMWSGMMQGKSIDKGHIQQGNKKLNEVRIHPTQKPVALYKWLLKNYAKPEYKILDTHLGSGSICIACDEMGFEITGIELNEHYYEAAKKRIQIHQLQTKLEFYEK